VLKDSSGRSGTGLGQNRARAVLVISEVSLAAVLLVGAALLIRSFVALYAVDLGFDARNVVTMNTLLGGRKFANTAAVTGAIRDGLEQLRSLPGVMAAGVTCCLPLAQGTYDLNLNVAGRPPAPGQEVGWAMVSPGYFEAFKIPVERGRASTARDDPNSLAVVAISERMARQYWKDRDPLGDRVVIGRGSGIKGLKYEPVRQIVGSSVIFGAKDSTPYRGPFCTSRRPRFQMPKARFFCGCCRWRGVVRTQGEPRGLLSAIRENRGQQ